MLFTVPPRKPSPWYRPEKVPITVGRADYQRLDRPRFSVGGSGVLYLIWRLLKFRPYENLLGSVAEQPASYPLCVPQVSFWTKAGG